MAKPVKFVVLLAKRPCAMLCCFGFVLILFMVITMATITRQLRDPNAPAFPTTDNSGFLDLMDINSLRMNAVIEAGALKREAEDAAAKQTQVQGQVQEQQSVPNGAWSVTVLFKSKDKSNIFTPARIKAMKGVVDTVMNEPGYGDYCLKTQEGGMAGAIGRLVEFGVAGQPPPAANYSCGPPTSVLQYLYPSTSTVVRRQAAYPAGPYFTPPAFDSGVVGQRLSTGATSETRPVITYDGQGSLLAPCKPDGSLAAAAVAQQRANRTCFVPGPVGGMLSPATVPPFLRASLLPGAPSMGSCNLCNGMWCQCDAASRSAFTGTFSEGGQAEVDALMAEVARVPFLLFLLGKDFSASSLSSDVTRLTISFGGPLAGFDNTSQGQAGRGAFGDGQQTAKFKEFAVGLKKKLDAAQRTQAGTDMEMMYFWPLVTFAEILDVLLHDGLLALGSVAFVAVYLRVHTGSTFIAATGMFHIFMSFPLAFFLYRFLFGIMPFYTLSFLSIYVVLAIGADDVFVFVDAWKQSAQQGPDVTCDVITRMSWVYRRASKAMFVTSLTTFGAFIATAISPLNDVATFGLFTALLVAANYLYIITWFPAAVLVWHKYFEGRAGCCCCLRKQRTIRRCPFPGEEEAAGSGDGDGAGEAAAAEAEQAAPAAAAGGHGKGEGEGEEMRPIEKFFATKYVPLLSKKPFLACSLTVMVVVGGVFAGLASQLGPTTKEDQILPDWHPFQRIINTFNFDFQQGGDTPMRASDIVYGMLPSAPLDRSGIGRYDVTNKGRVVWDPAFDIALPASQTEFIAVCDALVTAKEKVNGQEFRLVRNTGLGAREVACPLQGLKEYVLGVNSGAITRAGGAFAFSFPVPKANFESVMAEWLAYRKTALAPGRRWPPHQRYENLLWQEKTAAGGPGPVKYIMIRANTTIGAFDSAFQTLSDNFEAWTKFVDKSNAAAPASMQSFLSAPSGRQGAGTWVFLTTQKKLVSGAINGAVVSAAFAFLILTASTLNPLLALIAICDIMGVVACILGMMWSFGWELGVIESVSATVLVGLSVDYVVHLANSYIESEADDRLTRVAHASVEMGITVFGGAITSLGASTMLFLCYFQYFFKFGAFMFLTITWSFIWAFFFFLPLLALAGPQGEFASLRPLLCCGGRNAKTVSREEEAA